MKYDIDEKTGLPQLPEGYFFRVREWCVEVRKAEEPTPWREDGRYFWSDRHDDDIEERWVDKVEPTVERGWFGRRKEVIRSVVVRETRRVSVSTYIARHAESVLTGVRIEDYTRDAAVAGNYARVTSENVMRFAQAAADAAHEWLDFKSIEGDYPPKRFGA